MKTIGLIGGMSWESSQEYYRIINQEIRARLGGTHSAKSLMWSMDFGEIERLQHEGRWDELTALMIEAAQNLERGGGGADFILICTNTMHKMADDIESATSIPLVHIADPTAEKIKAAGLSKVGLLGTAFTMEQDFYKGRLAAKHGLEVLTPDDADRKTVHDIIYQELVVGEVRDAITRKIPRCHQSSGSARGGSIILGCTEIMLLIGQQDSSVPVFDTTRLHAEAAVDWALEVE
ncbi:aspartate racemase [Brucella intermedia 229E]|uniref:Aspartate racemase n=1 Tax=Brucella intermedia 229E TaxID=1337887 RepID=U4VFA8_9HYPH|nr:aspartate racemase [Brucella intermedia 229E]